MPDRPRIRDSVWKEGLANGIVRYIDYESREVIVYFYNSKSEESLDFDEFVCNFNERLNQWVIR